MVEHAVGMSVGVWNAHIVSEESRVRVAEQRAVDLFHVVVVDIASDATLDKVE